MSERVRVRESMGERKKEYGREMEGERERQREIAGKMMEFLFYDIIEYFT